MNIEQKNQLIEQYINELVLSINSKYVGLITDEKKKKAIEMFKNSNGDLKSEIIPKINEIANQMIEDFVKFQNHYLLCNKVLMESFENLIIVFTNINRHILSTNISCF